MNTLAYDGPGPWVLFFPVVWAAVVLGAFTLLRRAGVLRGGRPPWRGVRPAVPGSSPIALLGRRFAAGEIDEEEYWRRLSVLGEQFGRTGDAP
ncbi:SHOCT domain-containing protein [Streptomyces sp. t39]|uniref:SHOCT domain-containing protein n=1 Tax=Streptomyces sp. t39 TaxID=1828156 RepID=UPI0011CE97CF|nr:SHOCT domain-containing protein [Streptomyces sp. t39]TXS44733.1 SHOCT domain-containing protein [Streptomyces sp. t39]